MNSDSLQAIIDSLQIIISETSKSIEPYTTLIESQQTTYQTLIYVLLGILAVNIIINFTFSRRKLRNEVENVFNEEKAEIVKNIKVTVAEETNKYKVEFNKKIAIQKMNIDRRFFADAMERVNYKQIVDWGIETIISAHAAGYEQIANKSGNLVLKFLNEQLDKITADEFLKLYKEEEFSVLELKEKIEQLPNYLSEHKGEIKRMLFNVNEN